MRRIAVPAALAALALPATVAVVDGVASGGPGDRAVAAAADHASVALTTCQPRERAAEFEARMEKVAGSARMKLRFTLEARKPRRGWRRVAASGLGGWRSASPETTRFISSRRVTQLVGPAHYRAVVTFRWVDSDGRTITTRRARSRACRQPDHRPNLRVLGLTVDGGRYVVHLANTGRSESGPFDLQVDALPLQGVESIAARGEAIVELAGPACESGALVTSSADPLDEVDERSERDNALSVRCP
jgi:hypothetical protein